MSNQVDIRNAIVTPQEGIESGVERVLRGMDATSGGIQYYAGQLSGFKAEVKDYFKVTKKLCKKPGLGLLPRRSWKVYVPGDH